MATRVPTISVTAGASSSSVLVDSSSQPSRRSAEPSSSGDGRTATVSTSNRRTTSATWVMSPSTGRPSKAVGGSPSAAGGTMQPTTL